MHQGPSRHVRLYIPHVLALAAVLGVLVIAGCSKDEEVPLAPDPGGGGGGTTQFTGLFTSGTQSGLLTVTINTGATSLAPRMGAGHNAAGMMVTASGTLYLGGSTAALTGMYDTMNRGCGLNGSGHTFSLSYDASDVVPSLVGLYNGPSGSGEAKCWMGAPDSIKVYCGTYSSTTSPPGSGVFSFTVRDTALTGYAHADTAGYGVYFEGTVTSTGATTADIAFDYNPGAYVLVGSGVLDTSTDPATVSGDYTFQDVLGGGATDAGTWAGVERKPTGGSNAAKLGEAAKIRP